MPHNNKVIKQPRDQSRWGCEPKAQPILRNPALRSPIYYFVHISNWALLKPRGKKIKH